MCWVHIDLPVAMCAMYGETLRPGLLSVRHDAVMQSGCDSYQHHGSRGLPWSHTHPAQVLSHGHMVTWRNSDMVLSYGYIGA